MTLRWPYQDIGITPLWNPRPTHVTMSTWLELRPSYKTHSYTTLRVKGTILRWPLETLSMHRKSADHLKVTWYIVRLKKIWSTKIPRGGGGGGDGWLSAYDLFILPGANMHEIANGWHNVWPVHGSYWNIVKDGGPTLKHQFASLIVIVRQAEIAHPWTDKLYTHEYCHCYHGYVMSYMIYDSHMKLNSIDTRLLVFLVFVLLQALLSKHVKGTVAFTQRQIRILTWNNIHVIMKQHPCH